VLAPAVAGSVLELGGAIHLLDGLRSCRHRLLAGLLRFDSDGPDEPQQFAPHRSDDLALVLARCRQPGIAFRESDLTRCMNIPARYVTGYIGDIQPFSGPGDFSAWYQVFLDGRWIDLDARHNYQRLGRILMATGREAADVAITTSFGSANLVRFYVESNEVDAQGNKIPLPHYPIGEPTSVFAPSEGNTPTQTNRSMASPAQTQPATS
jgi:hypothetical protein